MSRPKPSRLQRPVTGVLALAFLLAGCAGGAEPTSTAPEAVVSAPAVVASVPDSDTAGAYLSLADYERDASSFAGDDVVLFFAASWCSTCRTTRANIEADLAGIPPGLVIVVVDYDSATDVRRQYGVTVQHTFVQIDADGTELKKWTGSLTAAQIAEQTV
jgi:thiol-disulfide isomerase/thioredoxin